MQTKIFRDVRRSRYAASLGATAKRAHDWTQYLLGVGSLTASVVTGWRFGVAWGAAALFGSLFGLSAVTGIGLLSPARRADSTGGTLIPPGFAAIVTGEQQHEGEWVPPGFKVTMGQGAVTDDLGGEARVYGGHGNTAISGGQCGHPQ